MRITPPRVTTATIIAAVLIAAVTGCGTTVSGNPVRQETPAADLNVGNYQITPRVIGNATYEKQARIRESQRLADYVALPFEIEPDYAQECTMGLNPHIVLNHKGLGHLLINDTFDEVAAELRAGWVNTWCTEADADRKYRTLNLAVLQFPDPATAARVGPILENDDFVFNSDNQAVTIPKYPEARAHWRPVVSSIGAWAVRDRYVVFMKIDDETSAPDLPGLVARVERVLDVQLPLLDLYRPTPDEEFKRIPLDPEGLLGRTLPSNPENLSRKDPDGVYTGRGGVQGLDSTDLDFLTIGDIDQIAYGDTLVFRSRTGRAARALWDEWRTPEPNQRLLEPPAGLGDNIECVAITSDSGFVFNQCSFQVDRYNVLAGSQHLAELYQKTSAQYVLLTSR